MGNGIPSTVPPKPGQEVVIISPTPGEAKNNLQLYALEGATITPTSPPLPTSPPPTTNIAECGNTINHRTEMGILYAFEVSSSPASGNTPAIKVFYQDEWPLTLGKGNISQMKQQPADHVSNPNVGDKTAKDSSGLPYFPAVYLTDVTTNKTDTSGDAEKGGIGNAPSDVYGNWYALQSGLFGGPPPMLGLSDGNQNNLGPGADPWPSHSNGPSGGFLFGMAKGYADEIIWKLSDLKLRSQSLQAGHTYRAEFIIHDGDRDGDVGEGCVTFTST